VFDIEIRHEVTPRLPRAWRLVLVIGCGDCLVVVPGVESIARHHSWAYLVTMPGASRAVTVPSRSGIPPNVRLQLALDDATAVADARSGGQTSGDPLRWFDGVVDVHHTNCAAHGLSRGHVSLADQLRIIMHSQAVARPILETDFQQLPIVHRVFNVMTNRWVFSGEDGSGEDY
jgi:hypothetical protein